MLPPDLSANWGGECDLYPVARASLVCTFTSACECADSPTTRSGELESAEDHDGVDGHPRLDRSERAHAGPDQRQDAAHRPLVVGPGGDVRRLRRLHHLLEV